MAYTVAGLPNGETGDYVAVPQTKLPTLLISFSHLSSVQGCVIKSYFIGYILLILQDCIWILLWSYLKFPCCTAEPSNIGWRERNQQDATNLMFIIKLSYKHVSGINMPIIRRTWVCSAAYGVLHWLWWLWLYGAGARAVCTVKVTVRQLASQLHTTTAITTRRPYAEVHTLVLLMMSIMLPETCWDKSFIINIRLVESCWSLSLHPTWRLVLTWSSH